MTQSNTPYGYCECGCGIKTNIARRDSSRYGHTKGDPYRYIAGHGNRRASGWKPQWSEDHQCYEVPLTKGRVALIDEDSVEVVGRNSWHLDGYGYAVGVVGGRHVKMHRHIISPPPGMLVDHIDNNPLNNRKENLRIATPSQNIMNQKGIRGDNTTGYIGVYWHRRTQRWMASVSANGKSHHLGYFDSPLDAAMARDAAAINLHGEFATLNFPDTTGQE